MINHIRDLGSSITDPVLSSFFLKVQTVWIYIRAEGRKWIYTRNCEALQKDKGANSAPSPSCTDLHYFKITFLLLYPFFPRSVHEYGYVYTVRLVKHANVFQTHDSIIFIVD